MGFLFIVVSFSIQRSIAVICDLCNTLCQSYSLYYETILGLLIFSFSNHLSRQSLVYCSLHEVGILP